MESTFFGEPVEARSCSGHGTEEFVEIAHVAESGTVADFGDGAAGIFQSSAGLLQPFFPEIVGNGCSGHGLVDGAEMSLGNADPAGEHGIVRRFRIVFFDPAADESDRGKTFLLPEGGGIQTGDVNQQFDHKSADHFPVVRAFRFVFIQKTPEDGNRRPVGIQQIQSVGRERISRVGGGEDREESVFAAQLFQGFSEQPELEAEVAETQVIRLNEQRSPVLRVDNADVARMERLDVIVDQVFSRSFHHIEDFPEGTDVLLWIVVVDGRQMVVNSDIKRKCRIVERFPHRNQFRFFLFCFHGLVPFRLPASLSGGNNTSATPFRQIRLRSQTEIPVRGKLTEISLPPLDISSEMKYN